MQDFEKIWESWDKNQRLWVSIAALTPRLLLKKYWIKQFCANDLNFLVFLSPQNYILLIISTT